MQNPQSLRYWAHGVLGDRVDTAGYHTLATVGLLWAIRQLRNCGHANHQPYECPVTIALGDASHSFTPFVVYASICMALDRLHARNGVTAWYKKSDKMRQEKLAKEALIVDRLRSILQNTAHKVFKSDYQTTTEMVSCSADPALTNHFLEAWHAAPDTIYPPEDNAGREGSFSENGKVTFDHSDFTKDTKATVLDSENAGKGTSKSDQRAKTDAIHVRPRCARACSPCRQKKVCFMKPTCCTYNY
jgi:hypothetical protein